MAERFLKSCSELGIVSFSSMPVGEGKKREIALWLCRSNGPVPAECLQIGMAILRNLDLEKLADDEQPPFWALVGFLEWINARDPEADAMTQVLGDLRQMFPASPQVFQEILRRIGEKKPELKMVTMRVGLIR